MKKNLLKIAFAIFLGFILFFVALIFGLVDYVAQGLDEIRLDILYKNFNRQIKNEKQIEVKETKDFYGIWKEDCTDFKNRYEAIIDANSITVYKWDDGTDWKIIYWVGDFYLDDVIYDVNGKYIIESKNFTYVSSRIDTTAKSSSKNFTYDGENGGTISFISQYNDDWVEIVLNRYEEVNDRLRVVKYQGERLGGYDDRTNKKIKINNYEISYPAYFDNEEEETRKETLEDVLLPSNYDITEFGIENNFIVLSPSDTKSHAELFIGEYKNIRFSSIEDFENSVLFSSDMWNADNYERVAIKRTDAESIYSIETICSTKYVGLDGIVIYGMGFETHLLMKENNMVLIIGVAYTYDDNSKYDYLGDYKQIIRGISKTA